MRANLIYLVIVCLALAAFFAVAADHIAIVPATATISVKAGTYVSINSGEPTLYTARATVDTQGIAGTIDLWQAATAKRAASAKHTLTVENSTTDILVTVNGSVFPAKLYENATTRALMERFPLTLNMSDLNRNEKFFYLPYSLPTNAQRVGSIKNGDLMLYGSDCLVVFYKGFSTSYSYTRLGYVENPSGLAAALGSGNAEITFSVASPTPSPTPEPPPTPDDTGTGGSP
jgi:hypothetical protein